MINLRWEGRARDRFGVLNCLCFYSERPSTWRCRRWAWERYGRAREWLALELGAGSWCKCQWERKLEGMRVQATEQVLEGLSV